MNPIWPGVKVHLISVFILRIYLDITYVYIDLFVKQTLL